VGRDRVGPRDIDSRADLARELTALRARSGLTVRELARRLGTPTATVGDYFSGRHLPGPAQVGLFTHLLRECGVTDPEELELWLDALARTRLADGRLARTAPPYRGLEAFQAEDAPLFFGREAATKHLLTALTSLGGNPERGRLLIVVGPSGSGKSSLLRAGVASAVRGGALSEDGTPWKISVMTPRDAREGALLSYLEDSQPPPTGSGRTGADGLALVHPASGPSPPTACLLIVDQLEELFAMPQDARSTFVDQLTHRLPAGTLAIAGLRADFYEKAASEPSLLPVLQHCQVLLEPMTGEELQRAIIEPARCLGAHVEDGLVELLLSDLAPHQPSDFAHEAGALPLLSYALSVTWERSRHNQLTIADYRAIGGLRGAVSQSAEQLYGGLGEAGQALARQIFCRLVATADDMPPTRRRVKRQELVERSAGDEKEVEAILDLFVRARLVTAYADTVEVSHEALLFAWPRLSSWLDADREGLRLHHWLAEEASAWVAAGRDRSGLLRGARLQLCSEWARQPGHTEEMNRVEQELLDASLHLARTERRAARLRRRHARELLATVAVLAVVASLLAGYAFKARSLANTARDEAISRQVAIEASDLESSDPGLGMQLALAAYRISPTVQARSTLLDASADEMPTAIAGPSGPSFVAESRSGHLLAIAESSADRIKLCAIVAGHSFVLARLTAGPASDQVFAVALSPSGNLLAAGGTDGRVTLWQLVDPRHPHRIALLGGFSSTVYALAFSPGGRHLVAADNDGTLRVWVVSPRSAPALEERLHAPGRESLHAVGYSPSGRLLGAGGSDGTLGIWSARDGRLVSVIHEGSSTITSLAFSPTGSTVVTGSEDDLVGVFRLGRSGRLRESHPPLGGSASWINAVAFSPSGRSLAAASSDNSVLLFSTGSWRLEGSIGDTAPVTSVAFDAHGDGLVSADANGTTQLWSLPLPSTDRTRGPLFDTAYNENGRLLAAITGGPLGDVSLWDTADPWRPTKLSEITMPASFGAVAGVGALDPNGDLLAVGNERAQVHLLDIANRTHPVAVGPPLAGASPAIEQIVLSPNGATLAVGDDAGDIDLWDVARPRHPRRLGTLKLRGPARNVLDLAFNPDGDLLAAASADTRVWLFDVADPSRPRHLATLGGFSNYAYAVAFSPNGRVLVAGSADGTLRLWSVEEPSRPRPLGPPLSEPGSYVYSVAVSPDGDLLAASTTSHAVWLWSIRDPSHPELLADLDVASGEVFDVGFSPRGSMLVAGGTDQLLSFVDDSPAQVATRICSLVGVPISRSEWAAYVQGAPYDPPCR